ncbi:helix-turn-helix transcriptional regulator [Nocardioides nitrophenolicus]|uniref:helix-turn-helix transcriptional regulator n=1 Tax=Nocardioides nitrophenolicus TaxID=60489 RepID=UPI00195DA654|nr:LuxR family transcriptional regulator [Nocardioides nitrophenolicus]MBM7517774.1 DNA-binding CsgD family transcriptional regulator/RecA/RadA recombinase [Nocardioides nitrophenolicus]
MPTTVAPQPERQWPLLGRERELDTALGALGGPARIVTVHGPVGVGKTRLLAEVAARAATAGQHVVELDGSAILAGVPLGALSARLPGVRPYDGAAPDPARLFTEAGAALTADAGGRPIALVVDDVTLLDPASVLLVAQLAAAGRLRLVVALRHGDPLPDPLVLAWSAGRDVRIDLGPLSADLVQEVLEDALGGAVAHRTAATLHAASGGNPMYLRELVVGALADGGLSAATGVWQLAGDAAGTPTLRDLVLARVAPLGDAARDALERLAVCGDLRPDQLPGASVRPALTALEAAGLVRVGADGTVGLAQPVYRTVLTGSLSRLRAEDILTEQAALLAGRDSDLLHVTLWQIEAGLGADPAVIATAAQYAAATADHATVIRLTEAGLRTDPGRVELVLLRADALLRSGRSDESLALLERHPEQSARIARLVAVGRLTGRGPLAALDVLDRAARAADRPHPALELTRAAALVAAGRSTEAEAIVTAIAPLFGDGEQERARIALAHAVPLACLGHEAAARAAAERAVAYAEETEGRVLGLSHGEVQLALATVHHLFGRFGLARAAAVRALTSAADNGDEILSRSIEFLLGRIAADAGHLASAERWLAETISGATSVGPPGLAVLARLTLTAVHGAAGDLDRARSTIAAVSAELVPVSWLALARGWSDGMASGTTATLGHVADAATRAHETGNRALAAQAWQVALEIDRPDAAVAPLAALAAGCDSGFIALLAEHAAAAAARDPARLLEISEAWEQRDGLRLAAVAAAGAARAAQAAGSARTATAARARAEDLSRRCDGLDLPVLRTDESASPLTPREREIATLAGAGATSKEIAAQLFLSSRTVDNHLQSVYTKLGISGRQELAARR